MRPKTFWIVGAGTFGAIAVRGLKFRHPQAFLTAVDMDGEVLGELDVPGVETVCEEGAAFLADRLGRGADPDWIVPAVPVHLLLDWLQLVCPGLETDPVPEAIRAQLPNPMDGWDDAVYVSIADFTCPPDCPEPPRICTCTGKPRPYRLYEHLRGLDCPPYRPVVAQSRQLLPGVGGYRPTDLAEIRKDVEAATGPILLATACKCHGVVHAVSKPSPAHAT